MVWILWPKTATSELCLQKLLLNSSSILAELWQFVGEAQAISAWGGSVVWI